MAKLHDECLFISAKEKQNIDDFRDAIRPKHPLPDPDFTPKPYYQVHNLRQGFQPNMSALDHEITCPSLFAKHTMMLLKDECTCN